MMQWYHYLKKHLVRHSALLFSRGMWLQIVLLISFLVALIRGIVPPGPLVIMSSQEIVQTTHPIVGVHTRLTDEVEAWKIQRSLAMVRQMGAPWIVEYFPWPYIESSPGQYDWTHSDTVIAQARNQGLTVIARLGMVPDWARPDPQIQETTLTYLDAEHYVDFAHFVEAFVQRYKEEVTYIIIWNEPNLSFEWGFRPVDPSAYVTLLQTVYPIAHQANPHITVLAGALAPTLEPEGSPAGLNDLLYLTQMYEEGGADYFDVLAAHTYGLNLPPDAPPAPDVLNFRRVELLREIMFKYDDEEKPIFITESGWNDHPRWTWRVSTLQRETYTLAAYDWAEQHWSWCPALVMWMFRTPLPAYNYQDYYAFVTSDFQLRPIYTAVQRYTGNVAD